VIENNFYLVDCIIITLSFAELIMDTSTKGPLNSMVELDIAPVYFPIITVKVESPPIRSTKKLSPSKVNRFCLLSNRTFLPNSSIKCSILRMIASSKSDSLYRSSSLKSRKTYTKYV